jgi:hypothetical protein
MLIDLIDLKLRECCFSNDIAQAIPYIARLPLGQIIRKTTPPKLLVKRECVLF